MANGKQEYHRNLGKRGHHHHPKTPALLSSFPESGLLSNFSLITPLHICPTMSVCSFLSLKILRRRWFRKNIRLSQWDSKTKIASKTFYVREINLLQKTVTLVPHPYPKSKWRVYQSHPFANEARKTLDDGRFWAGNACGLIPLRFKWGGLRARETGWFDWLDS